MILRKCFFSPCRQLAMLVVNKVAKHTCGSHNVSPLICLDRNANIWQQLNVSSVQAKHLFVFPVRSRKVPTQVYVNLPHVKILTM